MSDFEIEDVSVSPSVEGHEQVIQELLSREFSYFGEGLNDQVQAIRESKPFKELTGIKKSLMGVQSSNPKRKKRTSEGGEQKGRRVEVTIFVKHVDDDQNKDNGFKKALLGAAYFPKELDPRTKSLPLTRLSDFKFLHRQLADAVFYEHPLAGIYLREIAGICNVPLDNPIDSPDFYKRFYDTDDVDLRDYNEYVLKFILPVKNHPEGAQAEQTDVAKKKISMKRLLFLLIHEG